MRNILIVTDAGLVAAGIAAQVHSGLERTGSRVHRFADVVSDPPEAMVEAAVAAARAADVDGVIGLGGGSAMDTAKLVALLARSGESLQSAYGVDNARGPRLPLIQVPTTAGTGSEVTPIAIVTTPGGEKKGVVSALLYADHAVLDATLTTAVPERVAAMSGIDALVHAIEAYTSRIRKNLLSDTLAIRAVQLIAANLRTTIESPANLDARRAMLQGAMLAGMAFANAPVGAVHALAYPLGGRFHVPHGLSTALVLLPVLEFNMPAAESHYAELSTAIGAGRGARGLLDALDTLLDDLRLERSLASVGVAESDLPLLARDAMNVQRLLVNNPRDVAFDDALAIYRQVL